MLFRSFLVLVSALAVPLASVVDAQDALVLAGRWQGLLVPEESRGSTRQVTARPSPLLLTVVITTASDGTHSWTWGSTQLNGQAPIGLRIEGNRVRISAPAWNGSWEGTLSADDSTLDGTWRQGGITQSLVLKRVCGLEPAPCDQTVPAPLDINFELQH